MRPLGDEATTPASRQPTLQFSPIWVLGCQTWRVPGAFSEPCVIKPESRAHLDFAWSRDGKNLGLASGGISVMLWLLPECGDSLRTRTERNRLSKITLRKIFSDLSQECVVELTASRTSVPSDN